jgi:WXXGXW repeat (2 copies)
MFGRSMIALLVSGGLALALLKPAPGRTEQVGRVPDAPEALARGPVHEAYAQPSESQPQPSSVIQRQPPAAVEEQPPDQKPEGSVVWVPGYWQWDEDRSDFIWVSGFWRVPPPGRHWVPGSYRKVDDGYQWVPGMWTPENQEQLNVLPQPPAPVESGPSTPPPADDSVYVPGNWVYRDARFLWRPGYYIAPRTDYTWIPSRYVWTPAGCVYVEGYWDYPMQQRGLLFSPVTFAGIDTTQPGYSYTPNYVVSGDFLPTALFVRPRFGHYYFGDYYGTNSVRAGYTPWIDFRLFRSVPDPVYVQARSGYGGVAWERNTRTLYTQRASGVVAAPPRTLAQQNASVRTVTVLSPLSQVNGRGVRLTTVPANERILYQQSGQQTRQRGFLRHEQERQVIAARSATPRNSAPPQTFSVQAPQTQAVAAPVHTRSVSHAPTVVRTEPVAPVVHETPRAAPAVIHHQTHSAPPQPAPQHTHHLFGRSHPAPAEKPSHSKPHKP